MKHLSQVLIGFGFLCLSIALGILVLTFYPTLVLELSYAFHRPDANAAVGMTKTHPHTIQPIDTSFGIVIPKIGANSKIIANVDPFNPSVYQWALTKGVAQAKGTALPYEKGNMFLFSHSATNFYEANHYNAIFYLLSKLTTDDKIYIFYKGEKYSYKVTKTQIVDPTEVAYLINKGTNQTLTLMTCWPPGTSLKRLLVEAVQTH